MAIVNLDREGAAIDTGNDSVVIQHYEFGKPGGTSIDLNGYTGSTIKAGHVVIVDEDLNYKLLPLDSDGKTYVSLPAQHTYAGVVQASVSARLPFAAILLRGVVNKKACPYEIPAAAITALKGDIKFIQD